MDGVHQSAVDQILSAIKHGNLGVDETERRLQELIQAEQAKPSAERDQRLIDSAEQLREELHHHTALSFEAKRQKNLDSTVQKYKVWRKQQHKQKQTLRISAFAAMLLLCLGLGSSLLRWNWFETKSSEDGEQYVIRGHEISLDTISQAIAAHNGMAQIATDNAEVLADFLGFSPKICETLLNKWIVKSYTAYVYPERIDVLTLYTDANNAERLSYTLIFALQPEDTFLAIEKSEVETHTEIEGLDVVLVNNIDVRNAAWHSGNVINWISGKVSNDELLRITKEVMGR